MGEMISDVSYIMVAVIVIVIFVSILGNTLISSVLILDESSKKVDE